MTKIKYFKFFFFYINLKGGITIAWVEHTIEQIPQIVMLQPFCHKDFGIRSLGDRIKDLNQCVTLYPDIPKDHAFQNYYTPLGGKLGLSLFLNCKEENVFFFSFSLL